MLLAGCMPIEKQNPFIDPHCLLSQSQCQVTLALGTFDILFNVHTVVPEQEFKIIVKSKSPNKNLEIKGFLEGKDMYMGKIPLLFTQNQPQIFSASTMLGSCSEKEMIWRMWLIIVDINHPEKIQKVFIDFKSFRH